MFFSKYLQIIIGINFFNKKKKKKKKKRGEKFGSKSIRRTFTQIYLLNHVKYQSHKPNGLTSSIKKRKRIMHGLAQKLA